MPKISQQSAAAPYSVRADVALSYVPVLLGQLDDIGREMLGAVMQACFDAGLEAAARDSARDSSTLNTALKPC